MSARESQRQRIYRKRVERTRSRLGVSVARRATNENAMTLEHTDKELLIACRRGDESSWAALVDRYQRLIYAIPRRAGLNEDQAGEVFQEVFVTLFEKMHEINEPDRLHAWLVRTARRRVARRRQRLRGKVSDDFSRPVVMHDLRTAPHPFFWSPFVLVGHW